MASDEILATIVHDGLQGEVVVGYFLSGRRKSEYPTVTDSVSKTISKTFSESLNVTDDSNGALAGDDISISFIKPIESTVIASESFSRLYSAERSDTDDVAGVSETIAKTITKRFSDSISVSESYYGVQGRIFDDTITGVTDDVTLNFGKNPSDSPTVTESIIFSTDKVLSDSGLASEQIALNVGKPFSDSGSASESVSFSFTKALGDSISISESLVFSATLAKGDIANATESASLAVSTPNADNGAVSESLALSFGKSADDDTASAVDSGSLRGQGYCDFDYFASDYVGYSRSFT